SEKQKGTRFDGNVSCYSRHQPGASGPLTRRLPANRVPERRFLFVSGYGFRKAYGGRSLLVSVSRDYQRLHAEFTAAPRPGWSSLSAFIAGGLALSADAVGERYRKTTTAVGLEHARH